MSLTDSAGTPWEGRRFEPNDSADDDGSAPPGLIEAIDGFRAGELSESDVVAIVRTSRFLIPLLAALGESGRSDSGHVIDKSQELSIVTVTAPDGRRVLPIFSSVDAMATWNKVARPVPATAVRVALAAASEGTDLVVIDPTSPSQFAIRRPALWAIAQSVDWTPCYRDEAVLDAFAEAARLEPVIRSIAIVAGDPQALLAGAEIRVQLAVAPGLDRDGLNEVLERLQARWAESTLIADRVDSLVVQILTAPIE
ncbi:MAG: SseB family protein [Microbacteriaceae bacterium]